MEPDKSKQNNQDNDAMEMTPKDDGQMAPEGSEPKAMMGGPQKSGGMKWLLWIILILLIIAGLIFGWLWWKDKNKKDETASTSNNSSTTEESTANTSACESGFTIYENTDLGIGFCYPTPWGTPSVASAKFASADTGQRWKISFASKSAVNLGLVTDSWSTAVARDGTCVDPATQVLPAFSPFSTDWSTDGTPVTSATRGIEAAADTYLINESVDDLLTNGVCLTGYTIINGTVYTHTAASYYAEFGGTVTTPQQHIDDPNVLIPAADRQDFTTFIKSIYSL